jgi:hypothetical protein
MVDIPRPASIRFVPCAITPSGELRLTVGRVEQWYKFARDRKVYNIDDFDQIWDDLRPFWSIPPKELRLLVKGMLKEDFKETGLSGITVRPSSIRVFSGTLC